MLEVMTSLSVKQDGRDLAAVTVLTDFVIVLQLECSAFHLECQCRLPVHTHICLATSGKNSKEAKVAAKLQGEEQSMQHIHTLL